MPPPRPNSYAVFRSIHRGRGRPPERFVLPMPRLSPASDGGAQAGQGHSAFFRAAAPGRLQNLKNADAIGDGAGLHGRAVKHAQKFPGHS